MKTYLQELKEDNFKLRELLWLNHGHQGLYGDDGEMQCSKCGLDYKRDHIEIIERSLQQQQKCRKS